MLLFVNSSDRFACIPIQNEFQFMINNEVSPLLNMTKAWVRIQNIKKKLKTNFNFSSTKGLFLVNTSRSYRFTVLLQCSNYTYAPLPGVVLI